MSRWTRSGTSTSPTRATTGSLKYFPNGSIAQIWGQQGTSNGRFNQPLGITVDFAGTAAYVTDSGNNRVQKFDLNGTFLTKWGTSGTGNGQFSAPYGIAIDSAGDVYVADTGNSRIQRFSPTGTFIAEQRVVWCRQRGAQLPVRARRRNERPRLRRRHGQSPRGDVRHRQWGHRRGQGLGSRRSGGLHVHGRRRVEPHVLRARRRRECQQRHLERTWIRRRARIGLFPFRDSAVRLGSDLGHLLRRLTGLEHRRVAGGGRHLHLHEPQARPDHRGPGLAPERPAGLLVHGRRRLEPRPRSSSTTTATGRCRTSR